MPISPSSPFVPPLPGMNDHPPRPPQPAPQIPGRNNANAVPWHRSPGFAFGQVPSSQYPHSYSMATVGLPGVNPGPISGEGIAQPGGFSDDWIGFSSVPQPPPPLPPRPATSASYMARSHSYPGAHASYPTSAWSAPTTLPPGTPRSTQTGRTAMTAPGSYYMGSVPLPGIGSGVTHPSTYAHVGGMMPVAVPQQFGFSNPVLASPGPHGFLGSPWHSAQRFGSIPSQLENLGAHMQQMRIDGEASGSIVDASTTQDDWDPVTGARRSADSRVRGRNDSGVDTRWLSGAGCASHHLLLLDIIDTSK